MAIVALQKEPRGDRRRKSNKKLYANANKSRRACARPFPFRPLENNEEKGAVEKFQYRTKSRRLHNCASLISPRDRRRFIRTGIVNDCIRNYRRQYCEDTRALYCAPIEN